MRAILIISLAVGLAMLTSASVRQSYKYRKVTNNAFQENEKLRYRVTWGIADAGELDMTVSKHPYKIQGREALHVKAIGKTLGAFSLFYKVYDVYESYVDQEALLPLKFKRDVNEGGYEIKQEYDFYHNNKVVYNKGKRFVVPENIQDMVSGFYYARLLNLENAKVGDTFTFSIFLDNTIYPLKIKYLGKETIKVRKGKFDCLKFAPLVEKGRYFKSEQDVQFWVSDDANKVPILVKAKIPVGWIKMHLVEWSGLKHELKKSEAKKS
ncbi:MAG: DUF3108 domain-containing protein [Crocinitomicaceae bacterium]|nr:DUF3108 domain-containing protein [Crocinitomicaceae bacterium]